MHARMSHQRDLFLSGVPYSISFSFVSLGTCGEGFNSSITLALANSYVKSNEFKDLGIKFLLQLLLVFVLGKSCYGPF